jgi:hypothetical protein
MREDEELKFSTSDALQGSEGSLFTDTFRDVFLQTLQTGPSPSMCLIFMIEYDTDL